MKPLTDATLRVRDAIYTGLLMRKGAELTEEVCRERANNLCTLVIETIREGLIIEMRARQGEPRSRYGFETTQPGVTGETMEAHAERIIK